MRAVHRSRAIIMVTAWLWSAAALAQQPVYTGRADLDLPDGQPGLIVLRDADPPADIPTPGPGGLDIIDVRLLFDRPNDALYVGVVTDGVFGDADGDGDPSGARDGRSADAPNMGPTEYLAIELDLNEDGEMDVLLGVPPAGTLADLGAYSPAAPPFGMALPGLVVTRYLCAGAMPCPGMARPHLEFTVRGLSAVPLSARGGADRSVGISARARIGSGGDVYPDDFVPGPVFAPLCPDVPIAERCDAFDNDCDVAADEGLGLGVACTVGEGICLARGRTVCDADPAAPAVCNVVAGAPDIEQCNLLDDDCDGIVDEEAPGAGAPCDLPTCPEVPALMACVEGMMYCVPAEAPPAEACNAVDDDCDGT
ncbi:MAG: hypothetical protein KC620_24700, partial [Myxococcales bacterium]|nr:hypothetical protein [Myxococcales bacterium]